MPEQVRAPNPLRAVVRDGARALPARLLGPLRNSPLRWRLAVVYGAVAAAVGLLLLLSSVLLVRQALSAGQLGPFTVGGRVPVVPLGDGRAVPLDRFQAVLREDAVETLYRQGLVALLVLVGVSVVVAYVVAGRLLRPLSQITATARRLSAERLDARLDLAGPRDELKELADVFDDMLDRLQSSFEAQRRFVADASHELRTPLAVMRTEIDVALSDPDASPAELRAAAEVVRTATERADRLVDSLLLLARSDRVELDGLPLQEQVELPGLCRDAVSAVAGEVAARGLQVATALGPAPVLGDPGLLGRLAGNLVENAVQHNVDGGWVRVDTGTLGDRARLQVSNTGAPLPPEEVPALFEPFRRSGAARTARRGAGLGLAIVRAVVQAHGGTVEAQARPGGGLVVTVDLPVAR